MIVATAPAKASRRIYRASPIKHRNRRTRAAVEAIKDAMFEVFDDEKPMTCRQMFYQLVTRKVIDKSEAEYQATVIRLLSEMRLSGEVPFGWIADNTRWVRTITTHDSISALLEDCQQTYRRDLWRTQRVYVEVWLEKDALAGVLTDITYKWGVPLLVSRGYSSLTFLQSAATAIKAQEKPCYLYQFGDHDPSGVDIGANIERRLRQFAPDAGIHFERIAVTPEQIVAWGLRRDRRNGRTHGPRGSRATRWTWTRSPRTSCGSCARPASFNTSTPTCSSGP